MRNYFKALRLPTTASLETIQNALHTGDVPAGSAVNALDESHRADAVDILCDQQRCQLYTCTVELYQRLHEASVCLDTDPGIDSHLWHERLADFVDNEQSADPL